MDIKPPKKTQVWQRPTAQFRAQPEPCPDPQTWQGIQVLLLPPAVAAHLTCCQVCLARYLKSRALPYSPHRSPKMLSLETGIIRDLRQKWLTGLLSERMRFLSISRREKLRLREQGITCNDERADVDTGKKSDLPFRLRDNVNSVFGLRLAPPFEIPPPHLNAVLMLFDETKTNGSLNIRGIKIDKLPWAGYVMIFETKLFADTFASPRSETIAAETYKLFTESKLGQSDAWLYHLQQVIRNSYVESFCFTAQQADYKIQVKMEPRMVNKFLFEELTTLVLHPFPAESPEHR